MECIFCKIINQEIPARIVFENDLILAFHDISPVAPVHIIIIPKIHLTSIAEISEEHYHLTANLQHIAAKIAAELGLDKTGYRLLTNVGSDGGQTVGHLHYHLLGGRSLHWPPG